MTLADNDLHEVIQAVRAIYDSSTLNQDRRRCTEKVESLKEGDPLVSVPIAFKLLLQNDKQVSHVGWNIIEHIIRYKWANLPGELRLTIRDGVLEHLSAGVYSLTSTDLATKTAISRSIVAMMEQEWPQNWPELFEQFKNILLNDTLYSQAQLVFIVLRRLIENVVTYGTISNGLRRKELSTAVNQMMPELFVVTTSRIRMCIAQGITDESILVAKAGIELLSESVDWVIGRQLDEVIDNILEVLCAYLRTEAHSIYEEAARCLFKIASRKRAKTDETSIVVSMFKDGPMNAILTAARMAAEVSSSNKGHYQYLKALCDLLCALGIHLSEIWGYIKNPPPNFANYLREIAYYFVHPSMCIRAEVALVLVTFASHENISKTQDFNECVKLLIPTIPKNIEKIGSMVDTTHLISHYARMDYEDDVGFSRDFMQLRDRVCRFIRESAKDYYDRYVAQINEWIGRIVNNPLAISFSEYESIKRYLTAFVSSIFQKFDNQLPKEVDESFVYNFNAIMTSIQNVTNPAIVNSMLSIPSSFLQLFEKHPELLQSFFEHLQKILMIDLVDQDLLSLKRHAISLMLKISSTMPKVIEPYAEFVFNIVNAVAPHVTVMQRANLIQVLGALSNLVQSEHKIMFLQMAISTNVEFFSSTQLIQAISNVGNFLEFIGLKAPPEAEDNIESVYFGNRLNLKAHLCAIDGILQQVTVVDGRSNPLFQLLGGNIPTFFQIARCLNRLTEDSNVSVIHPGYDRTVVDIGAHERHLIYCDIMEAETQDVIQGKESNNPTERIRRYIADITDMIQSIIGQLGSKFTDEFYVLPNAINMMMSIVEDLQFVIDFRLRFWIRRTFKSLICSCPIGKEDIINPICIGFLSHLQTRLKQRWNSISNVDYDGEPTKEEIFLEHMTYILSREHATFLKNLFLGDTNFTKDDNRKSPAEVISQRGANLVKNREMLEMSIATLCSLLNCNDTQTALKILPIARIVFGATFQYFDEKMCVNVFVETIRSLQIHGADEVALGPILSLTYQIYTNLRPKNVSLIEVLLQVPETTPEGIAAFDERIITMSHADKIVEKHRREIMKKILRPVIAKNIGEEGKRPSHLRVLQPLIKPPKINSSCSSDVSLEGVFS